MRRAGIADRRKIFSWLTASDLTPSVIGPPKYPDAPIPSWDEFRKDYAASFFNSSGNRKGRNFIVVAGTTEVGTVGYDLFDGKKRRVVLDIWMRAGRLIHRCPDAAIRRAKRER